MKKIFTLNDTKSRIRGKLVGESKYKHKYAVTKERLKQSDVKNIKALRQAMQKDVFKEMFPNNL